MADYDVSSNAHTAWYKQKVCLVPIEFNGNTTFGALDTGADISFIGRESAEEFGLTVPRKDEIPEEEVRTYTFPLGISVPAIDKSLNITVYETDSYDKPVTELKYATFIIPLLTMSEINEALSSANDEVSISSIRPLPIILGMNDFIERLDFSYPPGMQFSIEHP